MNRCGVPSTEVCTNTCVDQGAASCGTTGVCGDSYPHLNKCLIYPASTVCVPAGCSGGVAFTASACDGNGACVPGTMSSCGVYGCKGDVCGCATDADCLATAYCANAACTPKKPSDAACAANDECVTGLCKGGVCSGCAVDVTAGSAHTCARKGDGTLWCWGYNVFGQLGDGTTTDRASPVQVTALGTSVVQVAAGSSHTCALEADGSVWCWGLNQQGEIGDGTQTVPGKPTPVQVTALGTSVVQLAAGTFHTCARKGDGTLWCWGDNSGGELGDGTAVEKHSPVQVTALGTSVVEVWASPDASRTCARKGDGTLWCWGTNSEGEIGDGTVCPPPYPCGKSSPVQLVAFGTSVVQVSLGELYGCARKGDGTLWCWGNGYLGDGTDSSLPSPVEVVALGTSVVEVATGQFHTCARKSDGTVWCWGDNLEGELGNGTTSTGFVPGQVMGLTGAVELTAGGGHTCARKGDGMIWCWGDNYAGDLGDGTKTARPSPVAALLTCP
jgi:alpha-tubulin suppressor-like RCC1 family protein